MPPSQDTDEAAAIAQTRAWVTQVIVGLDLCPFARREVERASLRYAVNRETAMAPALQSLLDECRRLDDTPAIETTLLVFEGGFADFEAFLDLLALAEELLSLEGYEGTYQLASFHPDYRFAGVPADDAANYTNRAPWPTLHLIRETSISRALAHHPDPAQIPERNIALTREKGTAAMQALLDAARATGASAADGEE